jgi:hypothetical protein
VEPPRDRHDRFHEELVVVIVRQVADEQTVDLHRVGLQVL